MTQVRVVTIGGLTLDLEEVVGIHCGLKDDQPAGRVYTRIGQNWCIINREYVEYWIAAWSQYRNGNGSEA